MKETNAKMVGSIGVFMFGLITILGLAACERKPPMEAKQEALAPKVEAAPATESSLEMSATETDAVLLAPEGSAGRAHNEEGGTHAKEGHWDVAEGHFRKALEADPKLAEAQFNLGVALDKLGKHDEAKVALEKAAGLAPGNSKITESPVLKKHTST